VKEGERSVEERRIKDMYDIHNDISLGTLSCRFEKNRTRAAETLVSHKIYETN